MKASRYLPDIAMPRIDHIQHVARPPLGGHELLSETFPPNDKIPPCDWLQRPLRFATRWEEIARQPSTRHRPTLYISSSHYCSNHTRQGNDATLLLPVRSMPVLDDGGRVSNDASMTRGVSLFG